MTDNKFQQVCDSLSKVVDGEQFERYRWGRDEAPKLKRLAELTREAFSARDDFELTEEGATSDLKRFVIKVHGKRTIAVALTYEAGKAVIRTESVNRSAYAAAPGDPIATDYENVDEEWIAKAMQAAFSRIRQAGGAQSSPQEAQQSQ